MAAQPSLSQGRSITKSQRPNKIAPRQQGAMSGNKVLIKPRALRIFVIKRLLGHLAHPQIDSLSRPLRANCAGLTAGCKL